jgi:diguanylate cyclase (GGDEF)-like protein
MNLLALHTLGYQRGLLMALSLLVVTAAIDIATSSELSVAAIYVFPILMATWNCGARWGLAFALVASATQVAIGPITGFPHSGVVYFAIANANRLVTYLLFVVLAHQLRRFYDEEHDAAREDDLTKVHNRKGFREVMQHEIYRHTRSGKPLCVAYFDCDHFKRVNDALGHAAGDELLRVIATTLQQQVRRSDTVGRIGGDEFAVIFPETEGASLLTLISTLRDELTIVARPFGEVTFSVGVVTFPVPPESAESAIEHADRTMYRAKAAGRNGTAWDVFDADAGKTPTRMSARADADV